MPSFCLWLWFLSFLCCQSWLSHAQTEDGNKASAYPPSFWKEILNAPRAEDIAYESLESHYNDEVLLFENAFLAQWQTLQINGTEAEQRSYAWLYLRYGEWISENRQAKAPFFQLVEDRLGQPFFAAVRHEFAFRKKLYQLRNAEKSKEDDELLLTLALQIEDPYFRLEAVVAQSFILIVKGIQAPALVEALVAIRQMSEKTEIGYRNIYTLNEAINIFWQLYEFNRAKALQAKLLSFCDQHKLKYTCSSFYYNYGSTLKKSQEPRLKEAELSFRKALALVKDSGEPARVGNASLGIADALNEQGKYQEALGFANEAFEAYKKYNTPERQANALSAKAFAFLGLKQLGEAKIAIDKALTLCPPEFTQNWEKVNEIAASLYLALGDTVRSQNFLRQAYEASKKSNFDDLSKRSIQLAHQNEIKKFEHDKQMLELQNQWQAQQQLDLNRTRWLQILCLILVASLALVAVFFWQQRRLINSWRQQHQLLSEKDQLVQNLQHIRQEMQQANELLMQADKLATLGTLTASIAHDISNPVQRIREDAQTIAEQSSQLKQFLFDLMGRPESPEALRVQQALDQHFEQLQQATNSTQQAGKLLKELSQAIRNQARVQEKFQTDIDLVTILNDCLTILQGRTKGIHLQKDIIDQAKLCCRQAQIGQVLLNLLSNAIDALEGRAEPKILIQIKSETKEERAGFSISVEDNGPGIAREIADQVFQAFFTTKAVGKGTGLGLSIVEKISKAHQGKIEMSRSPSLGGAKFEIWLPQQAKTC